MTVIVCWQESRMESSQNVADYLVLIRPETRKMPCAIDVALHICSLVVILTPRYTAQRPILLSQAAAELPSQQWPLGEGIQRHLGH
jgi:hypothetical protein